MNIWNVRRLVIETRGNSSVEGEFFTQRIGGEEWNTSGIMNISRVIALASDECVDYKVWEGCLFLIRCWNDRVAINTVTPHKNNPP
ncbi:Uncharacterised protein [Chlamydia abortus]|uniref:hypothetical protein n=1 Tax=Paenibacillus sp. 32O-W TaxID=1695218 RepID=UPI000A27E79F|nr:Uncharacterised protein [Chlamydia abortus]